MALCVCGARSVGVGWCGVAVPKQMGGGGRGSGYLALVWRVAHDWDGWDGLIPCVGCRGPASPAPCVHSLQALWSPAATHPGHSPFQRTGGVAAGVECCLPPALTQPHAAVSVHALPAPPPTPCSLDLSPRPICVGWVRIGYSPPPPLSQPYFLSLPFPPPSSLDPPL